MPRLAQQPLHDEVRPVELLRLSRVTVTDDDGWAVDRGRHPGGHLPAHVRPDRELGACRENGEVGVS